MPGDKEKSSVLQTMALHGPHALGCQQACLTAVPSRVQFEALPLVPPPPLLMKTEALAEPGTETPLSRQHQWASQAFFPFFQTWVLISFKEHCPPSP